MKHPLTRAERRAAARRKKARVKKVVETTWPQLNPEQVTATLTPKELGRLAETPHPCSGLCCGNPRRYAKGKEKRTVQERRVDQ